MVIIGVNDAFWQGFASGMNEGVFHRSKRATLFSSERSRPAAEGPRDAFLWETSEERVGVVVSGLVN
jgi:hypothetical protein